jgi:Family of unknown function (DUF6522)
MTSDQVQAMKPIEFQDGVVQIDASVVAEGLGITLPLLRRQMQAGKITGLSERGTDADCGRHRVTFFSEHRRFRLVVDQGGAIVRRSTLDFGNLPLPKSARKPGG